MSKNEKDNENKEEEEEKRERKTLFSETSLAEFLKSKKRKNESFAELSANVYIPKKELEVFTTSTATDLINSIW